MSPAVEKLEMLLARIAKNRAMPRPVVAASAPQARSADVQSARPPAQAVPPRAATPMPAPAAPVQKATPTPAIPAPVQKATPAPAPSAPLPSSTPMPAPAAPVQAATPTPAPAAAKAPEPVAPKRIEVKTLEIDIDSIPISSMRDSEPELEITPVPSPQGERPRVIELSPFDEPDEPEVVEVASPDEPIVVLDDETADAEIIEPPSRANVDATVRITKEAVSDIEITIAPEPAPVPAAPVPVAAAPVAPIASSPVASAPAPVPAAPVPVAAVAAAPVAAARAVEAPRPAAFDEASFADVDIDAPPPPPPSPKVETVTPLEAAVRAAEAPQAIEPADVVVKTADVVRVVAEAKPFTPETFGSLIKRSLGLRLR